MKKIQILGGVRTAMCEYVGTPGFGLFKDLSAIELGAMVTREALRRTEVDAAEVNHVVMGNVMQTSADALYGARHVALKADLPIETSQALDDLDEFPDCNLHTCTQIHGDWFIKYLGSAHDP